LRERKDTILKFTLEFGIFVMDLTLSFFVIVFVTAEIVLNKYLIKRTMHDFGKTLKFIFIFIFISVFLICSINS
jgi:hypothetical protein